jgi:ACS family hexuronate transporter-like MFS transporter
MGRLMAAPGVPTVSRKWWICGLLLCASIINYMDRQTLANASVRITTQFQLTQAQYGNLELGFGWAFAAGSLAFGVLADRVTVRWLYPALVLLWSGAAFAAGLAQGYTHLLVYRTLLGFFEAGHWPCAIKTTQALLAPAERGLGNSLLQSGTSLGAIVTPLLMRALLTPELGSWRGSFQAISLIGLVWIALWLTVVREDPVARASAKGAGDEPSPLHARSVWAVLFSRRMLVVLGVVACINTSWQILRAWLPKFLMEGRSYTEADALWFNSLFYVATDVGCLGAGALSLWLVRRGWPVHRGRLAVFLGCAALTALTSVVAVLPKGWLLLGVLLLVGAGALGVFPIYHALTQDLSREHQGKVTGTAGIAAWAFSPAQTLYGELIDRTGSFDLGLALTGWAAPAAFLLLFWSWDRPGEPQNSTPRTRA